MFDYCSSGLWGSSSRSLYGEMIDYDLIRLDPRTSRLLNKWIYNIDCLFTSQMMKERANNKIYHKLILKDSRFINLEKDIKIVKRRLERQYKNVKFVLFSERDSILNKRDYIK